MYAILGFVIVLVSYFTLPWKFLVRSYRELAAIGERGKVEFDDDEELPMLNWLLVLGRCLIAIGAVLFYLFLILASAASDDDSDSQVFLAILFGPFLVIAYIWFWGLVLEFISLQILVARNTRLTYQALRGSDAPAAATGDASAPPPPVNERCEVCGNVFPTGSLTLVDDKRMCRQCAAAARL